MTNPTSFANRTSQAGKVVLLLAIGFVFRLLLSCTPTDYDPFNITYNSLSVTAIDNSGRYLNSSSVDTLYAEAVALKITLADTSNQFAFSWASGISNTMCFQSVLAMDPVLSYLPVNKVVSLKVKTLFDINETIGAGDEVSEYFLCSCNGDFGLYSSISRAIAAFNGVQTNHPKSSVLVALKTTVENTQAQFEIEVIFGDGSRLVVETSVFTILA